MSHCTPCYTTRVINNVATANTHKVQYSTPGSSQISVQIDDGRLYSTALMLAFSSSADSVELDIDSLTNNIPNFTGAPASAGDVAFSDIAPLTITQFGGVFNNLEQIPPFGDSDPQVVVALYYDNGVNTIDGAQYTLIPGSELVFTPVQTGSDLQRQVVNLSFAVPSLRRVLCLAYMRMTGTPPPSNYVGLNDFNFRGSMTYAT